MSLLRADHAFLNTPTVVTAVFVLLFVACPGKIAAHPPPQTQGEVVWQLDTHDGLPAPVQRAAFDPQRGTALLATLGGLYEVVDSTIRPIAERPAPEAKMTLAPGGGLYVWRTPSDGPEALWAADVFDIDGNLLGSLRPAEDPGGFGALLLGNMGRLIVTVLAIDDWRGTHGRFLYTFWSREGEILNRVERPSQESAVVAADGTSLLLLGEDSASAYASDGEPLWQIDGAYRNGAVAGDGTIALLNPRDSQEIGHVHVVTDGRRTEVLEMPTPVHLLRLAPDGSVGVISGIGRYFFLESATGEVVEGERLPFDGELFLSDLELVDDSTLAAGVLLREGEPPRHSWPRGGLAIVSRGGEIHYRGEYPIREAYARIPAVDVTFEVPTVIGFTLDTAVRIDFGR